MESSERRVFDSFKDFRDFFSSEISIFFIKVNFVEIMNNKILLSLI